LESQDSWNDHYGVSPNIPKPSIFPANDTETFMGIFHGELLNNQRVALIESCHVGGVPCCTEFPDSIDNFYVPKQNGGHRPLNITKCVVCETAVTLIPAGFSPVR
jgi:hypothetical protein